MAAAIEVRSLRKDFCDFTALDDLSLDIADNEYFTLLGPSGCGKTTLLRLIAGFEAATAGEILLFGQDIAGLEPNNWPVNTVFQQSGLFPHLSVTENVAFGLKMKGWPKDRRLQRAGEMLEHSSPFGPCRQAARATF